MRNRSSPRRAFAASAALLLMAAGAAAHHPVGIPQYRDEGGTLVILYNVLTEDYLVRMKARPGRPVANPDTPVLMEVEIEPRDATVVFEGGTWLSIVEDLGNRGEREVFPPAKLSSNPGARRFESGFVFEHPGAYIVKVEFTESPGRELLAFPLEVTSGSGVAGGLLKPAVAALLVVGALAVAGAAARRKRRRASGDPSSS